jgi:GAF domain-containing protein
MLTRGHCIGKGKGLVGRAAESGRLVLADDVYQAPGWVANPQLPDTRSELAVPISSGGTVLGVLDVQQSQPGALKQEDAVLVQAIANQVAVALQNARSYAETQQRADREALAASRLAVVARIATVVASIPTPDEMLQAVVTLVKSNFDLYHAHIYLLDASGETLDLVRGAGDVGRRMVFEGRQIALSAEKSLVARAGRARQWVIVNDVRVDPDFLSHPLLPETRSEMAVPMIAGERLVGVLDVQDARIGRFTTQEALIMTTLAAQAAVALQNARSYVRAQREAEREALINTISERIQATDSIESALQVAVREVGRALGARHASVRLGLEDEEQE